MAQALGKLVAAVVGVGCVALPTRADNWPGFRGTNAQSVSAEKGLPVEWGPEKSVRWRVGLPGRNNGSPVVWGDRVFVTQGVEKEKRRTVICFDRASGKQLWQSGVTYSEPEQTHPDNPPGSGTPATDGERVVACFGSAGLVCYDFAGKELWKRDLGKLDHMFGNAISPVIISDLVVVNFGPGEGTRLVAVDKRSGEVAWDAKPPAVDPEEQRLSAPRIGGPAFGVAQRIVGQGDKDEDAVLTREEMNGLASTWFDALDKDKTGKVTKEQLPERLNEMAGPGQGPGGRSRMGEVVGPALVTAADADKDGAVTREELAATFGRWFEQWGGGKGEPLDMNQVIDGLNPILPAPPARGGGGGGGGFGGPKGPAGSWSTPIHVRASGRDEIVVVFPNRLAGYEAKTGKMLWFCRGVADAVHPTPVWDEQQGVVISASSDMGGGTVVAVRPGGEGDVTKDRTAWRETRVKGTIGTGVVHDGRLYLISTDGFAVCMDAKTGKRLWQKRLEGTGDKSSSWSSMLLADGKIYVPNQSGDVFVLDARKEFKVIATNSVNEPTNASLAASNGELFLRTDKALWCIGANR